MQLKLQSLCDSLGVQSLVGLDSVWIKDNNKKSQLINKVLVGSRWCLYNSLGRARTFWITNIDTLLWISTHSELATYEKQERYPKTFLEVLETYGTNNGIRVADLLIPSWKWTDRLIYYSGNEEMKKANSLALDGRWKEAAEIWTKMAKSDNKNIQAKATYNMAVDCEMLGYLHLALAWVSKSYHVYNNPEHKQHCMDYIDILATRAQQERVLKKQFGD